MKRVFLLVVVSLVLCALYCNVFSEEIDHPIIKPVPGSTVTHKPEYKKFDSYTFRYNENGKRVEKKVKGKYWRFHYEYLQGDGKRDTSISPLETIETFKQAVLENQGTILKETKAELIFTIPLSNKENIWTRVYCNGWSGYYELCIVEEAELNKKITFGAGEIEKQSEQISHSPAETVSHAFPSLVREAEKAYLTGNKLAAIEKTKEAVLTIWNEVPLTVKNIRLVENTKTYVTRKNNRFNPGEEIHVNAEIFGYTLKRVGEAYSINISTDVYFMQGGEILAGQQNFGTFEIVSPMANTEFRLDLTYWLTEAPAGLYDIQTVVHDQNSGLSTKFVTQIEMKQ